MATFNGAHFLPQQIDSILASLGEHDELLVVDDHSTDATRDIIERYAQQDGRVRLLPDTSHKGILRNFSYGIAEATGDVIFLADQDDVWFPNKIPTVKHMFEQDPDLTCVLSDLEIIDQDGRQIAPSFFAQRGVRLGFWNNMLKNSYIGNAMAFRGTMKGIVLPIPQNVPMHDQWIGLLNERYGKCALIEEPLGAYRRHGHNVTGMTHGSAASMIRKRALLSWNLLKRSIAVAQKGESR